MKLLKKLFKEYELYELLLFIDNNKYKKGVRLPSYYSFNNNSKLTFNSEDNSWIYRETYSQSKGFILFFNKFEELMYIKGIENTYLEKQLNLYKENRS